MSEQRYRAFISYSHSDEAWASWLQRSLEQYRMPGSLAASLAERGRAQKLAPVFRDREDLPAAGNLSSAIQAALADSEFQIVLCSPSSAASHWVNEEIKLFHRLHGPGRVFAVIVGGEPWASSTPGRESEECFPPALRFHLDADGNATDAPAEPLAADAREDRDGRRYALLKVAAGMLGVGLDDLVRRDVQRRARVARRFVFGSLSAGAVFVALGSLALLKANEATHSRIEAEDLIQFMLTDLKSKLDPVGRLDILESVGERALSYYARQKASLLDDKALARRSKALMLLGTIHFRRADLDEASAAYVAAEQTTRELLRRAPNDPDRIFDHAQSVFYVGEVALRRHDRAKGGEQYAEYHRLARRLVGLDPNNPKWRLELAYATSNLGILKFEAGEYDAATAYFEQSVDARRRLMEDAPDDSEVRSAYGYAISWLALAELDGGHYRTAIELLHRQLDVYGSAADARSGDFSTLDSVVTARRRLAQAHLALGELDEAREEITAAETIADALEARDPENANWRINAAYIQETKFLLLQLSGDQRGSMAAAQKAVDEVAPIAAKDAPQWFYSALGSSLAMRLSLGRDAGADEIDARELESLLERATKADILESADFIGHGALVLAAYRRKRGDDRRARAVMTKAISALAPLESRLPPTSKICLADLLLETGSLDEAERMIEDLDRLGIRHPEYLKLKAHFQRLGKN